MSWRNEYKKKRRCVTNHTDGAKAFQKTVGVIAQQKREDANLGALERADGSRD